MRMLKLEIEALTVDSFHTAPAAAARGTVRGAQDRLIAYDDTECPSGVSACPILSCGSSCDPICPTGPGQPEPAAG